MELFRGQRSGIGALRQSIESAYLSAIGGSRSSDRIEAERPFEAFPRREAIILFERLSENQSRILMPRGAAAWIEPRNLGRHREGNARERKRRAAAKETGLRGWPEGEPESRPG